MVSVGAYWCLKVPIGSNCAYTCLRVPIGSNCATGL